jgi:hypothetical protein
MIDPVAGSGLTKARCESAKLNREMLREKELETSTGFFTSPKSGP